MISTRALKRIFNRYFGRDTIDETGWDRPNTQEQSYPNSRMVTIEIDEDVYEALQLPEGERSDRLKRELAVSLYAQDILSFGKARALADLTHTEFQQLLGERNVPRHYGEEELAEDIEYAG